MNIPNKVRISGVDYAIVMTDEKIVHNREECLGLVSYNEHTIELQHTEVSPASMKITLLHEILHAITRDRDMLFSDNVDDNETRIDSLARALYQLIADNPEMFAAESAPQPFSVPVDPYFQQIQAPWKPEIT